MSKYQEEMVKLIDKMTYTLEEHYNPLIIPIERIKCIITAHGTQSTYHYAIQRITDEVFGKQSS